MKVFNKGSRVIKIKGLDIRPDGVYEVDEETGIKLMRMYPADLRRFSDKVDNPPAPKAEEKPAHKASGKKK